MRLTNSARSEILKNVLSSRFKKSVEELLKKQSEFTLKVYNDVFSEKEQKLMESLPFGWLCPDDDFKVVFGGRYQRLNFNGDYDIWNMKSRIGIESPDKIEKLLPNSVRNGTAKSYDSTDEISEEFSELCNERIDLENTTAKAYNSALAALNSVTTVEKLVKVWPEVKPYIPSYLFNENAIQLPALRVDQLNDMLGLPKTD